MLENNTPEQLVARQKSQLTSLEALLEQEHKILQQPKPELLTKLSQEKNELLVAIQETDKTIEQNFDFKQAKYSGEFDEQLKDIKNCLQRCKQQNQINGLIIQQSQLSVERMKTSLLENHNKSAITYNSKGKTSAGLSSLGVKA